MFKEEEEKKKMIYNILFYKNQKLTTHSQKQKKLFTQFC